MTRVNQQVYLLTFFSLSTNKEVEMIDLLYRIRNSVTVLPLYFIDPWPI